MSDPHSLVYALLLGFFVAGCLTRWTRRVDIADRHAREQAFEHVADPHAAADAVPVHGRGDI